MKTLLAILRYVLVSVEFLVCVAGAVAWIFLSAELVWLSNRIGSQAELLKYFGLLPFGLVVYDTRVVKSILMPEADKRYVLQSWEFYFDIKLGCIVGLAYAAMFAALGISCLFFDWKSPEPYQSASLLTSGVGAITVSATLYFAHIKVEELFRKHSMPAS